MKYPIPAKQPIPQHRPSLHGVPAPQAGGLADPRLVIRGESISGTPFTDTESLANQVSFVDYLSCTIRNHHPIIGAFPLREIVLELFNIPLESCQPTRGGRNGYERCIDFGGFGSLSYGGESQRNTIHIQISGSGCRLIKDWLEVYTWGVSNDVKITRVDIAHDDFEGDTVTIQNAIDWYDRGLFCSNGRPPKRHLHDDFDEGDGKTFEVGVRGNSKYTRIYEKGKALGDPESPWVRAEVEFLSKDQVLGWEAILNPDHFLTGAYKAFEFLSKKQSKFERINREANMSLNRAIEWGRTACGGLINLLYLLYDGDSDKVIEILRRPQIPKALEHYYAQHLASIGSTP